jgi:hypothetical protein
MAPDCNTPVAEQSIEHRKDPSWKTPRRGNERPRDTLADLQGMSCFYKRVSTTLISQARLEDPQAQLDRATSNTGNTLTQGCSPSSASDGFNLQE